MPYDGSGNFSRLYNWQADAANSIKILAARMDGEFDNYATGMNSVLLRSGIVPLSGDLRLGGNNIIQLGSGLAGAPSLSFQNDATTGIYSNTVGEVSIAGAGVQILRVNSTRVRAEALSINRAYITPSTAELQVQGDAMLGGAGSNSLHLNGYYSAGWKYTAAGRSAAIRHDAATGILQFMTSINAGAANAASDIREVGAFNPAGDFSTIGAVRPGTNVAMTNATYIYTPFNAAVDTGLIRAGVQFDGTAQSLNFYTSNTFRGNFNAAGSFSVAGSIGVGAGLTTVGSVVIGGTLAVNGNTTLTGSLTGPIIQASIASGAVSPISGTSGLGALPSAAFTNNGAGGTVLGVSSSIASGGNNTSSYHYAGITQSVAIWYLYGNGTTSYTSDVRTKENIKPARTGYLADLMKIKVYKFDRRGPDEIDLDNPGETRWHLPSQPEPKEVGLLAQQVEAVFPGLVEDAIHNLDGTLYDSDPEPIGEDEDGNVIYSEPVMSTRTKSKVLKAEVLYGPIMLAAMQELARKVEALEAGVHVNH